LLDKELKLKQQEDWDNSGLQIGDLNDDISNIMLTLDIDVEAVEHAVNNNIDLIITHHPLLFSPLKSIDFSIYEGKLIRMLIKNNINLYSMHTNFDCAEMGVNQKLAEKLNINNYEVLHIVNSDNSGYGGLASIEPINIVEYANKVKLQLNTEYVKLYCNNRDRIITKVSFCGGSGSDFIEDSIVKNADVYITGDIKYHQAQNALQHNLCIIDAGHYYTEYHSLENIKYVLEKNNDLNVMIINKNTVKELII
jgi:dinuclear metal center YbgI/SA1388 family protein